MRSPEEGFQTSAGKRHPPCRNRSRPTGSCPHSEELRRTIENYRVSPAASSPTLLPRLLRRQADPPLRSVSASLPFGHASQPAPAHPLAHLFLIPRPGLISSSFFRPIQRRAPHPVFAIPAPSRDYRDSSSMRQSD